MGDSTLAKITIHFGGTMIREDEDYKYNGELGVKVVSWELYDISWARFFKFSSEEEKINAPIRFIWYKKIRNEMKTVDYVNECDREDMFLLICMAKEAGELEVFIEHDCTEHSEPPASNYLVISQRVEGEDVTVNSFLDREEDSFSDSDEEVDRPKEDEEPELSEDEIYEKEVADVDEMVNNLASDHDETAAVAGDAPLADENVAPDQSQHNMDDGDDVVQEAGNGGNDDRFTAAFEEGSNAIPVKEAYQNLDDQEAAEREAEDSDEDRVIEEHAHYPDTPVDTDEEWEQWDDPKGKRKGKRAQYHGDLDKEPYIWLFQKFNSGLEFKDQLLRYSLKTQYDVKMARSEANRIGVICCGENCKFRVYCSFEPPINKWMVKVCHMHHNHRKSSRVSMLKQGVIAALFREEIRRNINLQASVIKDTIEERYNIVVPLSKCQRGRRIALNQILEAQTTQFGKLWDYEAELRRTHPDIRTDLCTIQKEDGVQMFDCFYICFEEFRSTWKDCCRPVIGLDGCFLKWELNGDLLSAVGRDAIEAEQKGLVIAIEAELPNAEHRMCARHIYANWKKQGFRRSEYKNLFWGVAYSYTEGEYEENLQAVMDYDPSAHAALLVTEPQRWCRAFFRVESHCADVHNNLSESFNRTIKMARAKPVITMLEDIRRQAMRRISRRFLKTDKCDTPVTPITMALLEKARIAGGSCSTTRSSRSLYEVQEWNVSYAVNLSTHQCACRKWDLTGLPCKHAMCVIDDNQDDPVRYVPRYYFTHVFKKTYEDNIKPVNGEKFWKKTNKPPVGIPELRKPRGRPKNRDRRKEPFEDLQNAGKSTRHGRIPHCSQCKQAGHIKSGCKNEPVVVEGPKNRRGRPRKHPNEVKPKPPSKPGRKRKTTTTETASQPIPSNAAGEAEVSSSAPQPSTSANQVIPHVKKKPRGQPLKIKKTIPVPYGVGTFWSPFANRPFEVFGDRVYDRSSLNPMPPEDPNQIPQVPQAPNQPPQDPNQIPQVPQVPNQPPQDPNQIPQVPTQPPQDPNLQPAQDPNSQPLQDD